ncbi:MAG: molybdopterin molybdenumtransferase MoeA, partial [Lachnospiraceae bacterium]|nr:molybdopterin molybdenumtransferase MoeA [Lachnospiraceae bacterium]
MNDKVQELEIEEALTALLDCISPIMETEMIKLDDANGAVCAGDIRAGAPVPAFPRSAMDGYAVRAKD